MSRDSFQDLHLEKSAEREHIRLMSEGGNSLIKSPKPLCIDSIQISQTCTTESPIYRPVTGSCAMFSTSQNALFSVPSEHGQELDDGRLPTMLLTRFVQQGITLSNNVRVQVHRPGRIWYISDEGNRYSVRKLAAHLTVYRDSD